MYYDIGIADGCAVDHDAGSVWYWHQPAEAIMQYTGLKDKNGVEIYEGDILRSYSHPKIDTLLHEIRWREEITGWWMHNLRGKDDKDGSCQLWVGYKYGPFEVIGNIYEDPDLIK